MTEGAKEKSRKLGAALSGLSDREDRWGEVVEMVVEDTSSPTKFCIVED